MQFCKRNHVKSDVNLFAAWTVQAEKLNKRLKRVIAENCIMNEKNACMIDITLCLCSNNITREREIENELNCYFVYFVLLSFGDNSHSLFSFYSFVQTLNQIIDYLLSL